MKIIKGSVCAPLGFLSSGIYVGIKRKSHKKDVGIIFSKQPAVAAGVCTTNLMKAAPVLWTEKCLASGYLQAIVVNSGNANACTGSQGTHDAELMAKITATALHIAPNSVAVASTGVIGVPLPIEKIVDGIQQAAAALAPEDAGIAHAILTTDTFTKSCAVACEIHGKKVCIGGVAKGSGMIHPQMATMLGFITTDIAITPAALKAALIEANADSFHMITVDGDTSTNDMLLVLANGMAKNEEISDIGSAAYQTFTEALKFVCADLAKKIAQDGEGATKLIEVQVTGAASKDAARQAARAVCRSSLVKSAVFGEDANWGRVASALGSSGVLFDPEKVTILLSDLVLFKNSMPLPFDEKRASEILKEKTVVFHADLGMGTETATAWGCDLTYDYVKINASYRS
jgi:glutamate N-acetyltransferase/amino-acid N-acetyltransferase